MSLADLGPSSSSIGLRTPTPSVYVIPPEEEQGDTPPWCCYDAEGAPSEGTAEDFIDDLDLDDQPARRSEYQPGSGDPNVPRMSTRSVDDLLDAESMDLDEDVVEVFKVGRKSAVREEAAAPENVPRSGTWKKLTGISLRARAAQAFSSMKSVKDTNKTSNPSRRAPKPSEKRHTEGKAKLQRKLSRGVRSPSDMSEDPLREPLATYQVPRSRTTPTLSRRLSQLFVLPGRASTDLPGDQPSSESSSPKPPPPSNRPSIPDDRPITPEASSHASQATDGKGSLAPNLKPSRRFSMRDLKSLFTGSSVATDTAAPAHSSADGQTSLHPSMSLHEHPPIVSVSTLEDTMSPSSSSYSPYIGSASPRMSTDAVRMTRDAQSASSDGSTEPPETPTDLRRADAHMEHRAVGDMGKPNSRGSPLEPSDESMEMQLDSLHFDSLRFDADEFQFSF